MDLRCFVAVELPGELRETIHRLTGGLRASGAKVKWVPSENLHLTLKFLGVTPPELISDIRDALARSVADHRSFPLLLKGAGAFPDMKRPRTIWVGVHDSDALSELQRDIDREMELLGYAPEQRDFNAHITIGRAKSEGGLPSLKTELRALEQTEFGQIQVEGVSLMKSELLPSGAKYERLFHAGLA